MNTETLKILTDAERDLVGHVQMFGSTGYPVRKIGSRWFWVDAFGVKGAPSIFKTKREAAARFELWMDLKRAELGQEAQARAIADLKARGYTDAEVDAAVVAARAA